MSDLLWLCPYCRIWFTVHPPRNEKGTRYCSNCRALFL